MTIKLTQCIESLHDLRNELNDTSNRFFFQQRFVSSTDAKVSAEKVRLCIDILCDLYPPSSLPSKNTTGVAS